MHTGNYAKVLALIAGTAGSMWLCSCTDDSYDLENIDGTIRVEVKDLTLPVNLAPIEFDDIIDLDNEECVEVINGEYVLIKKGTFDSEQINIKDINADPNVGEQPASENLPIFGNTPVAISPVHYDFDYTYYGVDEYIVDLTNGHVKFNMIVTISAKDDHGHPIPCEFTDMKFGLPAGFYGSCDNPNVAINEGDSPIIEVRSRTCQDGVFKLVYHVTMFNRVASGATLIDHNFHLASQISLLAGKIKALEGNGTSATISVEFTLDRLHVTSFDGTIRYDLDELEAEAVELNDLPKVLTDPETNIGLKNPQVYFSLSNPLYKYGVKGNSGLTITQQRDPSISAYMPKRLQLMPVGGDQYFCLAPNEITDFYSEFPNATWYELANLGNILKGKGLPAKLNIDFVTPKMDQTEVTNFKLGENLGKVHGEYTFYAPLDFTNDSRIIYSQTQGGWGLGDDESLAITQFKLKAHVKSELPVALELYAFALNEKGGRITDETGNFVRTNTISIPAFADEDIELVLEGKVNNIDGMDYTVKLAAGQDATALRPTMHLSLTNLKAVVSGYYESDVIEDDSDDYDDDYYDYEY